MCDISNIFICCTGNVTKIIICLYEKNHVLLHQKNNNE